jgi:DNA-binding beta-propeller fold protein YncE
MQFDNPIDIADDDDDNTWITDGNNNRVLVFDGDAEPTSLLASFGSVGTAEGQFMGIYGIFVTDAGFHAYVTEVDNHRVQKFVPTSPTSVGFDRMWGGGVDDGSAAGQICTSGCEAGTVGTGEGEFNAPRKAIVGGPVGESSGNVIVADTGNHRLQIFDTNGNFIEMWGFGVDDGSAVFQVCTTSCQAGIAGTGDGQFNMPSYLAVDGEGNILVADQGNHRIQILDSDGNFLTKWGSFGTDDGQFFFPAGVFFRPNNLNIPTVGSIYVSDAFNRIQMFALPALFAPTPVATLSIGAVVLLVGALGGLAVRRRE